MEKVWALQPAILVLGAGSPGYLDLFGLEIKGCKTRHNWHRPRGMIFQPENLGGEFWGFKSCACFLLEGSGAEGCLYILKLPVCSRTT